MHPHSTAAVRGPVRPAERNLAPDLARGAMLLFIALANAPGLAPGGPAHGQPVETIERVANVVLALFVQARAYPVFGIMLGYGMVQLARRQEAAGASPRQVRALLRRRSAWLFAFGFVHAALLYFGDFLGAYGIIGLVAPVALLHRERVLRAILWIWTISAVEAIGLAIAVALGLAAHHGVLATPPVDIAASSVAPNYLASVVLRLHEWVPHTLTVLPSIFIVALGMWAAERELLEDVRRHTRLLRRVAIAGLSAAVLGAVPLALVYAGIAHADAQTLSLASYLHKVSGMFGGAGYAALLGIVAGRLTHAGTPTKRIGAALSALGERSLSGYLFQSLAWLTLLPPYTLGLASRFGSPLLTALTLAVVVWVASVLGATALRRRSWRGPAEVVLRRLTYGRADERSHRNSPLIDDQRLAAPMRTLSDRKVPAAEVPTETM
jgi:uncharacterized protein